MNDKIHIDQLHPSPTQPRKNFKQSEHEELRDSMVQHGFAFGSLLLRPRPGSAGFEIIIGERRTRAARAAIIELRKLEQTPEVVERIESLEYPPHRVSELSDTKVRELQLIENLQRSDLNPIEEAEGYRGLLDLRGDAGETLHTIDSIAKRIGRDRTSIERRLLLCNLGPEGRGEVESGRLDASIAYYIARIPDERLRDEATKVVLHPEFEEGPLTQRRAQEEIAKLVRDLRKARFDTKDPILVCRRDDKDGQRIAGGACTDCLFRFADKQRTTCFNPSCFDEKTEAEWLLWQTRETDPKKKRRALTPDECDGLFSQQFPDQPTWSSGLVSLDQSPAGDELRPGESAPGTWRMMTEGADLEILVARESRNGRAHELVKREPAIAAARQNGFDVFKTTEREKRSAETRASLGIMPPHDLQADSGKSLEQTRAEWLNQAPPRDEREAHRKQAEKQRTAAEEQLRELVYACFAELRKKAESNTGFLRKVALAVFGSRATHEDLLKRYKLPVAPDISRNVARWRETDLVSFIVELLVTDAGYNFELDDDDRSWFKLFGIDPDKIAKRLASKK